MLRGQGRGGERMSGQVGRSQLRLLPLEGRREGMLRVREVNGALVFPIRVQPRAPKSELVGVHAGVLKIRLTAPPLEGAANVQCLRLLAEWLGVSPARLRIVAGARARHKEVSIAGMGREELLKRLGVAGEESTCQPGGSA